MQQDEFPPLPSSTQLTSRITGFNVSRLRMDDGQEFTDTTTKEHPSRGIDAVSDAETDLESNNGHVLSYTKVDTSITIVAVKSSGDLLLNIPDALKPDSPSLYRVSVSQLRLRSPFFDRLLDPDKFEEGARVKKAHEQIHRMCGDVDKVDPSHLPVVDIQDVDSNIPRRGSGSSFTHQKVVTTYFRIMHGKPWSQVSVTVPHLACVAALADRFDSIATFREEVRKTNWIELFKRNFNKGPEATEELLRQKLLLAIFLKEYRLWSSLSAKLITQGSCRWEESPDGTPTSSAYKGLWWDLPCGVEDELLTRRICVIETINSIQTHLVNSYIPTLGRPYRQQCLMGYGNSPQCDSFQLGEALRFFSRVGTLHLSLAPMGDSTSTNSVSSGNAHDILHSLAGAPSHQIDPYHRHCGIRLRIRSMIETMERHWMLGICGYCWEDRRAYVSWQVANPPERCFIIEGIVSSSHSRYDLGIPAKEKFSYEDTCRCASSQRILSKLLFTSLRKEWEHICGPDCEFFDRKAQKPTEKWRPTGQKSVRIALSRFDL